MRIHALYRYPVKSLGGQRCVELVPAARGFLDDRRWMFADSNGKFISQREHHQLTHFSAEPIGENGLRFCRVATNEVIAELQDARPQVLAKAETTVWDDTFLAAEVSLRQNPTLLAALGLPDNTRLLYMPPEARRPVDQRYAKPGEEVSFADGYPYLITTTGSLRALAEILGEELDERRFRPNLIIDCDDPWSEDQWKSLRIEGHQFDLLKPCARCVVVTLDPETGEAKPEILTALSQHRRIGNKVLFGMNAVWRGAKQASSSSPIFSGASVECLTP